MNLAQAVKAIQRRWLDVWPTVAPSVGYAFDYDVKAEGAYFARLAVTHVGAEQRTMGREGARRFQRLGMIDVRLSGPINEGRGALDALAQKVIETFEARRFGKKAGEHGVVTHAAALGELRRDKPAPQSWILSVVTPFE